MCIDTAAWGRIAASQSGSIKEIHFDSEKFICKTRKWTTHIDPPNTSASDSLGKKKTVFFYSLSILSRLVSRWSHTSSSWIHGRKYRHLTISKFIEYWFAPSPDLTSLWNWSSFTKSPDIQTCFACIGRMLLFTFVVRSKVVPSFQTLITLSIS